MDTLAIEKLFSVKGKVVLISGGSAGIGFMIASGFVANGCTVYISSRKADACDAAAKQLTKLGPGICHSIPADISTKEGCDFVATELAKREKHLNVLINNAGANWGETFENYPDQAFDKVLALNVKSIFNLTRACFTLLKSAATETDPARVINLGSIDGIRVPELETYAYSASKAAVHQLTRTMANKLAQYPITVNAIAAGAFESKMMKATLDRFGEVIRSRIPLKRVGTPEDITGVCIWLSSRAGSWTTGAIIAEDGGALVTSAM